MVYIIVLNWNNFQDTISCLKSLSFLDKIEFNVVLCDNASTDNSVEEIKKWFSTEGEIYFPSGFYSICQNEIDNFNVIKSKTVTLIENERNGGYAAGNNVGIKFALKQLNMEYVWILNNDTEVDVNSLYFLVDRFNMDSSIGICGSKLVYFHDRDKIQGLGGIYNSWICKTKSYKHLEPIGSKYLNKDVENKIDYVIGASMLISRDFVSKVGLLCEDYFLYYEEIDICLRGRKLFKLGVSTDSIVYHKEGASTHKGKSMIADYCSVRNRLLVTKKFYPCKLPFVWFSLFYVLFNRIRRREYKKAKIVARIMFLGK